jgi:membrane dipeptidase
MTDPDHPVFDAHSDLPFQVVREREGGREAVVENDFLPGMLTGGVATRVAAIYLDETYLPEGALHRALVVLSELHRDVAESDGVELATTAREVANAEETEAVTLILGMEGAEPLMGDARLLDSFYRSGLRLLTLTHSRRNAVGDGTALSSSVRGTPGGLSDTGIEVVERAQRLGVVVDVSHLNDPGLGDALSVADQPLVASHSNCRALCDHPRNLTDDRIEAIADTGGVVCITAVGSFLAEESPDVDDFCDHVEHAVEVAGVDHVGLGFDFFEYLGEYLSERERARMDGIATTDGLRDDEGVPAVPARLRDRGFSAEAVAAICRDNLRRVFRQVLD